LPPQVAQLAGGQSVDDIPQPSVGFDRLPDPGLVLCPQGDYLHATFQVNREDLPPMPGLGVLGARAVGAPASAQPLHDAAAHERLVNQGHELAAKLAAATLDILSLRWHICNIYIWPDI
jgi:hypothetical protein